MSLKHFCVVLILILVVDSKKSSKNDDKTGCIDDFKAFKKSKSCNKLYDWAFIKGNAFNDNLDEIYNDKEIRNDICSCIAKKYKNTELALTKKCFSDMFSACSLVIIYFCIYK